MNMIHEISHWVRGHNQEVLTGAWYVMLGFGVIRSWGKVRKEEPGLSYLERLFPHIGRARQISRRGKIF